MRHPIETWRIRRALLDGPDPSTGHEFTGTRHLIRDLRNSPDCASALGTADHPQQEEATTMTHDRAGEQVSITGTAINNLPLTGTAEFVCMRMADDGTPVACVTDGALSLEISDSDTAQRWITAATTAFNHLFLHEQNAAHAPEATR